MDNMEGTARDKMSSIDELPAAKALRRAIEHAVLLLNINLDTGSRAPLEIIALLSQLEHMAGGDTAAPESITCLLCKLCNQRTPLKSLPEPIAYDFRVPVDDYEAIRAGDFSIVEAAPIAEILSSLQGPLERICGALSCPLVLNKEVDENKVDHVNGLVTMGLAAALTCVTLGFGTMAVLSAGAAEAVAAAAMTRSLTTGLGATAISSSAVAASEYGRSISRRVVRPFFVQRTELSGYVKILRALVEILPRPSPEVDDVDASKDRQVAAADDGQASLPDEATVEELEDAVGQRFSQLGYDGWDESTIKELIARLAPAGKAAPAGTGWSAKRTRFSRSSSSAAPEQTLLGLDGESLQRVVVRAKMLEKVAQLRRLAEETKFVVVIGPQNAGKSTLIKGAATSLGRPAVDVKDIGLRLHTTGVGAYEVHQGLWMVDFPGCNSISEDIARSWRATFSALPSLCLLVVRFSGDVDDDAVRLHQQIREQYPNTDILVVVNQVDLLASDFTKTDFEECQRDFCMQLQCNESDVLFTVLEKGKYNEDLRRKGVLDARQLASILAERACPLPVSGSHAGTCAAGSCCMHDGSEDSLDRALGALYDPSHWRSPFME